jgi:hypothetical protein
VILSRWTCREPRPRAPDPITQSEYFLIENRRHDPDGNGTFTFDDVNHDGCFDFYEDSFAAPSSTSSCPPT